MTVDVDALRVYLLDLCGTAVFAGLDAVLVDVAVVENASGEELLAIALRLGINPTDFEVR